MAEPRPIRADVDRLALETVREILRGPGSQGLRAAAALRFLNIYLDSSSGASTTPAAASWTVTGPKGGDLKTASASGATDVPALIHGGAAAPEPCAPDEDPTRGDRVNRVLTPLEGPDGCGHVSEILTNHVCIRGAHPGNPRGHVYVAWNGSDVPDRHTLTEAGA